MCSPTVSGLGFSGGVWVDGGLGFWSRRGGGAVDLGFGVGFSSRGSPVCCEFKVGLGFWSQRGGGAVGLRFGVGFSSRGSSVCRGFEVGLGFWISTRWWAVGLPWVWVCLPWGCRGFWESTTKKKIKMRREKSEMRREKKKS